MIDELDRALLADPCLAALSGRFLFALDDGRRDVSQLPFDLGYQAESADAGTILVGSPHRQIPVARDAAVQRLIELARSFLGRWAGGLARTGCARVGGSVVGTGDWPFS